LAIETYRRFLERWPEDSRCPSVLQRIIGIHRTHTRKYGKATEVCQEFLEKYPGSTFCPQMLLEVASYSDRYLKDTPGAIRAREQFLSRYPEDPRCAQVLLSLAGGYAAVGQHDQAIKALRRVVAECGNHAERQIDALRALAATYAKAGKLEDARRTYRELAAKFPIEKLRALDALAKLYERSRKTLEAIKVYEELVSLSPKQYRNVHHLNTIASLCDRAGQPDKAIATYRRIASDYPRDIAATVRALQQAASIQRRDKDYDAAIATYGELRKLPELEGAYSGERAAISIGWALAQKGQAEEGVKVLRTYIERNPPEQVFLSSPKVTPHHAWEAHRELARAHERSGDHEAAVSVLEGIHKSNRHNEFGRLVKAEIARQYSLAKQPAKMIAAYEEYASLYPGEDKSKEYLYAVGGHCAKLLQDPEKAAQAYERFRKTYPKDDRSRQALLEIGALWRQAKAHPKAVAAYEEYVLLYPKHDSVRAAMRDLGEVLLLNEQPEKAKSVFRKLIDAFPLTPEAQYVNVLLSRLPGNEGKE